MFDHLHKRFAALAIAAIAMSMAVLVGAGSAGAQSPANIHAKVGQGEPGYSVNAFLPQDVTVRTGDSVTWAFGWYEPHMIVLDNGLTPEDLSGPEPTPDVSPFVFDGVRKYVYSGVIFGDPANPTDFTIQFQKAGDYHIECLIHPGMVGSVKVVDTGTVDTQATADARATSEYASAVGLLKTTAQAEAAKPTEVTPQSDGTKVYNVDMIAPAAQGELPPRDYIQQYFPPTVNITAGDSITWRNSTFDPHTVTFNPLAEWTQGDPFGVPPTSETSFDGTAAINSGILGVQADDSGQPLPDSVTSFTLKFTTAGTFDYICLLHAPQGMTGSVVVAAAPTTPTPTATATATATPVVTQTTAPKPPNTGTGIDGGSTNWTLYGFGAIALFLVLSGGAAVATRRR